MANGFTVHTRMSFGSSASYGPYAENSWHFSYNPLIGSWSERTGSARAAILAFWNDSPPSGADSTAVYLSSILSGEVEFWFVDWEDPEQLRQELDPGTITPGTTALPPEVACCLTTKCDPYGGYKRQSFYNRIYLGPLSQVAAISAADHGPRPRTTFLEDLVGAYSNFQDELDLLGPDVARPAVYSPKHGTSGLVTSGWVDNEWDIVRRRGLDVTEKVPLVIA